MSCLTQITQISSIHLIELSEHRGIQADKLHVILVLGIGHGNLVRELSDGDGSECESHAQLRVSCHHHILHCVFGWDVKIHDVKRMAAIKEEYNNIYLVSHCHGQ